MDKEKIIPMKVTIFGREYPVACPAGEENALLHSAKLVDSEMRKVREAGKVVGTDRIAMMVSLNFAHELLVMRHNQSQESPTDHQASPDTNNKNQKRVDAMNRLIDDKLEQFQLYLPD